MLTVDQLQEGGSEVSTLIFPLASELTKGYINTVSKGREEGEED